MLGCSSNRHAVADFSSACALTLGALDFSRLLGFVAALAMIDFVFLIIGKVKRQ